MSYEKPTLKIKYIKPSYLEMAQEGFEKQAEALGVEDELKLMGAGAGILAITGGARAAVDTGEKMGETAGKIYVSRTGTPASQTSGSISGSRSGSRIRQH